MNCPVIAIKLALNTYNTIDFVGYYIYPFTDFSRSIHHKKIGEMRKKNTSGSVFLQFSSTKMNRRRQQTIICQLFSLLISFKSKEKSSIKACIFLKERWVSYAIPKQWAWPWSGRKQRKGCHAPCCQPVQRGWCNPVLSVQSHALHTSPQTNQIKQFTHWRRHANHVLINGVHWFTLLISNSYKLHTIFNF